MELYITMWFGLGNVVFNEVGGLYWLCLFVRVNASYVLF